MAPTIGPVVKLGNPWGDSMQKPSEGALKIVDLLRAHISVLEDGEVFEPAQRDILALIIDRETRDQWILCSDRMPEVNGVVDACVPGTQSSFRVQYCRSHRKAEDLFYWQSWTGSGRWEIEHFTLWQPLPTPPEES